MPGAGERVDVFARESETKDPLTKPQTCRKNEDAAED